MNLQQSSDASPEKIEEARRTLKIELIRRGWGYNDLADAVGVVFMRIANVAGGRDTSKFLRRKIERCLNMPIWSASDEFELYARLEKALGFDPSLATLPEIVRRSIELRVLSRATTVDRTSLFRLLDWHFDGPIENDGVPRTIRTPTPSSELRPELQSINAACQRVQTAISQIVTPHLQRLDALLPAMSSPAPAKAPQKPRAPKSKPKKRTSK